MSHKKLLKCLFSKNIYIEKLLHGLLSMKRGSFALLSMCTHTENNQTFSDFPVSSDNMDDQIRSSIFYPLSNDVKMRMDNRQPRGYKTEDCRGSFPL